MFIISPFMCTDSVADSCLSVQHGHNQSELYSVFILIKLHEFVTYKGAKTNVWSEMSAVII